MVRPLVVSDSIHRSGGITGQLIEGQVVAPEPRTYRHQALAAELLRLALPLMRPGHALPGPLEVYVDARNRYLPDLVLLRDRPDPIVDFVQAPLLVAEIMSNRTRRFDAGVKCVSYLASGVREVWLIDPVRRQIERHDELGVESAGGALDPSHGGGVASRAVPGFVLDPRTLFHPFA